MTTKLYSEEIPGGELTLNWEPRKYKSKAAAAKGLHAALVKMCRDFGMNPDYEVWIKNPEESEAHGYVGKAWHVCWESGPYSWAVGVFAHGEWGHCETYWGFDLAFYE